MASNTSGKETNKCILIVLTVMTSAFVGTLVSWIMIQIRLEQYVTINSILGTNPDFKEELGIHEPSKLSLDAIESWQSWMKTNGLFQKASKKHVDQPLDLESSPMKKILYWNDRSDDSLEEAGCPISQCQLVNRFDVDDLKPSEFDAVLFRYKNLNLKDLPKERLPHQTYVLYERDSPLSHSDNNIEETIPSNFFNLTMTYRWDSDVVVPIGGWIEPESSQMIDDQQFDKTQSKIKIAWMVDDAKDCSNADDRKIELIYRLRSYNIQVDIIRNSDCSLLDLVEDCSRKVEDEKPSEPIEHGDDESRLKCRQKIAKEYAFYYAIEEKLCRDYITEQFYSMLDHPIIPLVMDAHDNYAKAAPPHSYINAIDFPSVHDFANYLIHLSKNPLLYNEYFVWKKYFKVRRNDDEGLAMNHLCNLCAALHDENKLKSDIKIEHSYEDIDDWWVRKAACRKLEDFTMVEEVVVFQ